MHNAETPGDPLPSLEKIGRNLVHDIATPLATMQLNLRALTTYLPRLIEVYRTQGVNAETQSPISPDHLVALAQLPAALDKDIQRLRGLTQTFLVNITRPTVPAEPSEVQPQTRICRIQRVLLVEDEEVHQQITLKQLAGYYPVDVANTGAEALRQSSLHAYDLVLLDFVLPGMDGRSLVAALRQLLPPGAAIVALSNMPLLPGECATLGIQGILEKPFRLTHLEALMAGLLKGPAAGVENQR